MSIDIEGKVRFSDSWARWVRVTSLVLGLSFPAFAALGGNLDSVQSDQAYMKATTKIAQINSYAVHQLKAPTGTLVREYVTTAGRVFGVAWQGPFIPDMRQLLGEYFQRYAEAAKAQRENRSGRRPFNMREPDLVVESAGHMLDYSGRAYVPGLLPAGVSSDDVR